MSKKVLETFYQTEAEAGAALQAAKLDPTSAKKLIVRELTADELLQEKKKAEQGKINYKAKSANELKAEEDRMKKEYDNHVANLSKLKTL
jgi:peptidyl-tRNA hydrolase